LARNSRVEEDLVDQLFNSSEKRLARVLLLLRILARRLGRTDHSKVSQETLAEMIGDPIPREFLHEQISKTRLN
jgi:hypothetical protein